MKNSDEQCLELKNNLILESPPRINLSPLHDSSKDDFLTKNVKIRSVHDFVKLESIGEGSYGIVYKARDKINSDIVALKKVKMEKENDGIPVTSLREITLLKEMKHPNIVQLKEVVVGSSINSIYLVFEYLEHDLASLIDSLPKPFNENEIKCFMIQLLQAIEYLHFNWIVHRDLKCSNLLYGNNGYLKLADFGLAKKYGRPQVQMTPKVVTLWYRAPELLLGEDIYSSPIDMWAVGCIFGELLLGRPMLAGNSELDQLDRIYKLLGTPNDKIWPGYTKLPFTSKLNFPNQPYNCLNEKFPNLSKKGLDLLNCLLTFDPVKRITASECLKHPYFSELPYPNKILLMPKFPIISKNLKKKK
ncbi:putative protein serine/threonine kinase [Tieghemostelium lacteum]|uniref:cyclin-dependent kinase n=1 Tax=Tieghemostelium lacteum TaxID=361077 RepID=A0A152A200_TIELA|nr:putative protein serine/threonine kinase [Tieghemostelium lacteum]|eukprot:KYR00282.1 putative protein serine/threonine kinase [Tieghemostelium lacteum]